MTTAQARQNSLDLTCRQVIDLVRQNGVVTLYTGPHIFQRVVSSQKYCQRDELTARYYTDTKDKESCGVGYYCRTPGWRRY